MDNQYQTIFKLTFLYSLVFTPWTVNVTQNSPDRHVSDIPSGHLALSSFTNVIFIYYGCSQVSELHNIFKGFVP
jgi:hypothetical protein